MNYLQQTDKPLFPNLLWSRPETKLGAGKLLIIGGQAQEFIHVAESYSHAEKAGAGSIRVIMPDSTRKITKMLPNIEYAPSNSSGSFAKAALAELLDTSQWADAVLLAGDLGKNSETNLMLESYVKMYCGPLTIAHEAMPSLTTPVTELFQRDTTTILLTLDEFQKIGTRLKFERPVTSSIGNLELADILHLLTTKYAATIVACAVNQIWNSSTGQVAVTKTNNMTSTTCLAANSAVWTMQNPSKVFEATATAVYCSL